MTRKALLTLALAVLAGAASAAAPINEYDPGACASVPNLSPQAQPARAKPAGPAKAIARAAKSSPRKASGIPRGGSSATARPRPPVHLANPRPPVTSALAATGVRSAASACPQLGRGTLFNAGPDGALANLLAGQGDDPAPVSGHSGWGNSDGNLSAIVAQNTEQHQTAMEPIAARLHAGEALLHGNTFAVPATRLSDPLDSPGSPDAGYRKAPMLDIMAPEIDVDPLLRPTINVHSPEERKNPLAPLAAASVPEPGTLALLALAGAAMLRSRRRGRR